METTSPLRLMVFTSVDQIDRARWDSLRDPPYLLTDLDYLKAIEESQVLECQYRYFEFYQDQDLISSMAGYLLDTDIADLSTGFFRRVICAIRKILPGFLKYRTLEIGSPITLGLTISMKPGIDKDQLSAIFACLKDYAKEQSVRLILVRDFREPVEDLEKALSASGFALIQSVPAIHMHIVWKTFDEYLADFRSNYRHNIRRHIKRKEQMGIRTVQSNQVDVLDCVQEYERLLSNVVEKSSELPREHVGQAYHLAMYHYFRENSCWLQYFQEDELIAFLHLITYNGTLYAQYIGLDYQISKQAMIYFNVEYDLVHYAIENGLREIEAGAAAYCTKAAAGFSIYPQRIYLLHHNPLFLWIARLMPAPISSEIDECHYVFKDQQHQYLWKRKRVALKKERKSDQD
jgi:predicted N-acyltransferase